ncbi:MAG: beta-galactosidase BgaS [Candidatus Aenigmatarchaeota archaeon]
MLKFPDNFLWGTSVSAFQHDGSHDSNVDWYKWVTDKGNIAKGIVSGDLPENGPDYWHLFRSDHTLAKSLGMNAFRFNIEWSRIFPKSTESVTVNVEKEGDRIINIEINDKALQEMDVLADKHAINHYSELINDLQSKNLTIIACINHFTLPMWLNDPISAERGWLDEKTIIEFAKYAKFLAWKFPEISRWATINEPNVAVMGWLNIAGFPPAIYDYKKQRKCMVNLVHAHARAYDAIKSVNDADVGIIYAVVPAYPLAEGDEDAAKLYDYQSNDWFLNAVVNGEFDRDFSGNSEDCSDLKGRTDWIGINYYSRAVVRRADNDYEIMSNYGHNCQNNIVSAAGNPVSDFGQEVYPEGFRKAISIAAKYGKPIYITENGIADAEDRLRSFYIISHLQQLHKAIYRDRADVRGYFYWSLTDNYEWTKGFAMKFGLFAVNKKKERLSRNSACILSDIAKKNGIPSHLLEIL